MTTSIALGLVNTFAFELEGLYVPHTPEGFPDPKLLILNEDLVNTVGIDLETARRHGAELFSGTQVPSDSSPLAQAYAGHQFGGFSPQLGDGRAVLLGELDTEAGRVDLQLKGSGRTPFSRGGDGKATLGPILREYLVGEAMHALGIPTTRVLAAATTGETVRRDGWLPGAVLARVASSHLRVGTLQFFAARQDHEKLTRLVMYALKRHYPESADAPNPAKALLDHVATAQATLIAGWMGVGFVHGVMNTDNTTLSGETIDYGPCAFMDTYDPATVFSSIDHHGRYAYGNQPGIGQWNLARMGEALLPLLHEEEDQAIAMVEAALDAYVVHYTSALLDIMRAKLGLVGTEDKDAELVTGLLDWMQASSRDFTTTFRTLADTLGSESPFCDRAYGEWEAQWHQRLGDEDRTAVAARMNAVNPLYIPRNHNVEAALEAAISGDLAPFEALLAVVTNPFIRHEDHEDFANPAPSEFGRYRTFCGT